MSSGQLGQVRIIGGKWRSRKLNFVSSSSIVCPTPDRIRETLFNWLGNRVIGASCLDCFAGSGALSFEALSRGAKSVLMFDISPICVKNLKENAIRLGAIDIDIRLSKFPPKSDKNLSPFDIVFLDPPYHKNLIKSSSFWLEEHHWVQKGGVIYIEAEKELWPLPIPVNWKILKRGIAGQIGYYLILAL